MLFLPDGIPSRNIVPSHSRDCLGSAGEITQRCGKGRCIVAVLAVKGDGCCWLTNFIGFKLDVSVEDRRALWNGQIPKTHPHDLVAQRFGVITQFEIAAIDVHSAITTSLFDIINCLIDAPVEGCGGGLPLCNPLGLVAQK